MDICGLFLRLGQDGVSLRMTEDLLKTRMMWAETCTGTVAKVYRLSNGAFPLHGTARYSSGRFAFPLQFSTAIEWV